MKTDNRLFVCGVVWVPYPVSENHNNKPKIQIQKKIKIKTNKQKSYFIEQHTLVADWVQCMSFLCCVFGFVMFSHLLLCSFIGCCTFGLLMCFAIMAQNSFVLQHTE